MASLRKEGVDALGEEGMNMIPKRREIDTSAPNFSQDSLFEHTYPPPSLHISSTHLKC